MPPLACGSTAAACTGQRPQLVTSVRPRDRTGFHWRLQLSKFTFVHFWLPSSQRGLARLVAGVVTFASAALTHGVMLHDQDDFVHWTTVLVRHVKKMTVLCTLDHLLSVRPSVYQSDRTGLDRIKLFVCPSAHLGWTGPDQAVCACVANFLFIPVAILFKCGKCLRVRPPIWAGPDSGGSNVRQTRVQVSTRMGGRTRRNLSLRQ